MRRSQGHMVRLTKNFKTGPTLRFGITAVRRLPLRRDHGGGKETDHVNKFWRTASTQRLLATIAGFVGAIAAGTAIAIAAQGGGPVPAAKSLPRAIHDALAA